jgi:hypothetical protein
MPAKRDSYSLHNPVKLSLSRSLPALQKFYDLKPLVASGLPGDSRFFTAVSWWNLQKILEPESELTTFPGLRELDN